MPPPSRPTRPRQAAQIGLQWIVVNLAAGNDWNPLVEQLGQPPEDTALGLATKTQEDEVVTRENRIDELREDGLVESDDAGEIASPACSFRTRLSRISCLTDRTVRRIDASHRGSQLGGP